LRELGSGSSFSPERQSESLPARNFLLKGEPCFNFSLAVTEFPGKPCLDGNSFRFPDGTAICRGQPRQAAAHRARSRNLAQITGRGSTGIRRAWLSRSINQRNYPSGRNRPRQLLYLFRQQGRDFQGPGPRHEPGGCLRCWAGISSGSTGTQREREALGAFLAFARAHKEIYRIIDEAEFADPASYRSHYEGTAARIAARLEQGVAVGAVSPGDNDIRAWAIMGMNVFLGLRFGVWGDERPFLEVLDTVEALLDHGLAVTGRPRNET
jgi:hypothetical protein